MSRYLILIIILLAVIGISMAAGSVWVPLNRIFDNEFHTIVFSVRLPRIVNAISVGALLSVSGLLIQNLVKNPLADPYILGVSGASAMVQLLIIVSGVLMPLWMFILAGFIATALSLLVLLKFATKGTLHSTNLLLSGVVIAFAYSAVISLILTLSPVATTKPLLFWLMGDLGYSQWTIFPLMILILGISGIIRYHKELDLLARGEFFAMKCGVDVKKMNLLLLLASSLFTAMAVSMAGTVGFIGLVIPHIARLITGNDHARLIPLSAILGALVLLIADTVSRTIVAPVQLPVGVFTALLGVPTFLYLLRKNS